jgi:hypothetical protein
VHGKSCGNSRYSNQCQRAVAQQNLFTKKTRISSPRPEAGIATLVCWVAPEGLSQTERFSKELPNYAVPDARPAMIFHASRNMAFQNAMFSLHRENEEKASTPDVLFSVESVACSPLLKQWVRAHEWGDGCIGRKKPKSRGGKDSRLSRTCRDQRSQCKGSEEG